MTKQQDVDLGAISPDQFAELVGTTGDSDLTALVHAVGTEPTLDRIFKGFEERFLPEKARAVGADVRFNIADDDHEYSYVVSIKDGTCTTRSGDVDDPRTTLSTDLVTFAKLVTGHAEGVQLFMTRKLKISGDLMFAAQLMSFFERPGGSGARP